VINEGDNNQIGMFDYLYIMVLIMPTVLFAIVR
jgi:hypothetical protein